MVNISSILLCKKNKFSKNVLSLENAWKDTCAAESVNGNSGVSGLWLCGFHGIPRDMFSPPDLEQKGRLFRVPSLPRFVIVVFGFKQNMCCVYQQV